MNDLSKNGWIHGTDNSAFTIVCKPNTSLVHFTLIVVGLAVNTAYRSVNGSTNTSIFTRRRSGRNRGSRSGTRATSIQDGSIHGRHITLLLGAFTIALEGDTSLFQFTLVAISFTVDTAYRSINSSTYNSRTFTLTRPLISLGFYQSWTFTLNRHLISLGFYRS